MPSFCPDCGTKLGIPTPNFCPDCGKSFGDKKVGTRTTQKQDACSTSIHELGIKLEKCVEIILKGMGYSTEWRQRIRGKSGVLHEIDVVARKNNISWAVECKNWKSPVGKELIGGFYSKIQDLGSNWNGIFVSYQGFTEPAQEYAEQFNIKRWDTERLKEEWLAVSVGRARYAPLGQKKTVKNALPINFTFLDATNLNLRNSDKSTSSGMLSYTPYFVMDYSYNARYKDPTKQSYTFKASGKVYVNALDCSVLNPTTKNSSTVTRVLKLVISKEARQTAKRIEKWIQELQNGVADKEYSVEGGNNYTVRILKPVISPSAAKKEAMNFVISENTETIKYRTQTGDLKSVEYVPKVKNINIKSMTLVNIPRWDITFEILNRTYSREMFANSGTVLEDSIRYCPEHTGLFNKENIAACELCGQALCEKHVNQCPICGKWLCHKDGTFCESCGKIFCHEHISLVCSVCNSSLCSECKIICASCGKIFGKKHLVTCSQCGKEICSDCSNTIGRIRRKKVCNDCNK